MKQLISIVFKIIIVSATLVLINCTNVEAAEIVSVTNDESKTLIGGDNDNSLVSSTETITFFSEDPLPERTDEYVVITRDYDNYFDVVIDSDHSSRITITPVYYYYQSGKVHLRSMSVSASRPGLLWSVSFSEASILNTDGSLSRGEVIVTFSHGNTLMSYKFITNLVGNNPVANLGVVPYNY